MAIVSTSALRKITFVVLTVALLTFGATEIHKRFIVPRQESQQTQIQIQTQIGKKHPSTISDYIEIIGIVDGVFQKWERVPNSPDRYALLADSQTGELFPKVRVGFEFSPLYGDGSGREDATVFAVEKSGEDYDVLGYLKDFTSEEIDKLIQPGDEIKIMLKKRIDKVGNLEDEKGNLLANWLFIKRDLGKESVEKEVGREIQSP